MQFGRFLNDKRWRHEGKTKQSSFPQILLPRQVFSSAASSNLWETDRVSSSPCEISSIIPRAFLNVLKACQEDCSYSLTTVSGEVILLLSWQSLVLSRLSLNINWRHSTSIQPQGSSYGNKPLATTLSSIPAWNVPSRNTLTVPMSIISRVESSFMSFLVPAFCCLLTRENVLFINWKKYETMKLKRNQLISIWRSKIPRET